MKVTFLGQGYEALSELSVGNQLIKFFADERFHTFTGISAFSSQAGVNGLAKCIAAAKHLNSITIITGIDQEVTSKEALEALLALEVGVFVFYQPSPTIFHPKVYLFEGDEKSELIVGSSNLTVQGLFTNIEASLLISIDNIQEADREVVRQFKKYFEGIFAQSDPNLKKLSKELIIELVKAKLVPTEAERKAAQNSAKEKSTEKVGNNIAALFPKRAIPKIPNAFKKTVNADTKKLNEAAVTTKSFADNKLFELLWESGALTERDLNVPKASNTNPTGSMLFKKGRTQNIDQRHYFRDIVFSSLQWVKDDKPDTMHIERAKALFNIIVEDEDHGNFKLVISHNTRTDTPSYQQRNSMTSLSWGKAKEIIARDELIGKKLSLYRNKDMNGAFVLVIE